VTTRGTPSISTHGAASVITMLLGVIGKFTSNRHFCRFSSSRHRCSVSGRALRDPVFYWEDWATVINAMHFGRKY